jgi:hypothetical protein
MRFYDVQRGRILIDGVDVRDWTCITCVPILPFVLQDVFLFSGTYRKQHPLGKEGIDRDRWSGLLAKCMPNEIHTKTGRRLWDPRVQERGAGLSVGQKQLISFARALAFDLHNLILDEATSSIDTETEQLITKGGRAGYGAADIAGRGPPPVYHSEMRPHHSSPSLVNCVRWVRTTNCSPSGIVLAALPAPVFSTKSCTFLWTCP